MMGTRVEVITRSADNLFTGVPRSKETATDLLHHSSLIFSLLHSHANLEWCDKIKLSNLLLPRKSGTIKSLQLLSTSATLLALEQLVNFDPTTLVSPKSAGWCLGFRGSNFGFQV